MEPLTRDRDAFFADAKAFLSRARQPGGPSVMEHIGELLLHLAEERPQDALQAFERYSFAVKRDAPPRRGAENAAAKGSTWEEAGGVAEAETWARADKAARDLFRTEEEVLEDAKKALRERRGYGPPGANEDDDEEVDALELPEPNDGEYPDVLAEQRLLEWAGTGLSAEESYELTLSIKRLVEAVPIAKARFWGKVLGTNADYYIVESEFRDGERPDSDNEGDDDLDDEDDQDGAGDGSDAGSDGEGEGEGEGGLPPVPKPRKSTVPEVPKEKHTGVNRFTYWASDSACGEWVRLPSVTPAQIRAAKSIRRYLTGDPRAEVPSYPPFPGREAELLRAQIARITHATSVAPAGMFMEDEDADEEDAAAPVVPTPAEDFEPPSAEDLAEPEGWVHTERKIHAQGRVAHFAPEPKDSDDEDEGAGDSGDEGPDGQRPFRLPDDPLPSYFTPDEEHPPVLAPVTDDTPIVADLVPAFSVRKCGESCPSAGAVALVSRRWPGAVTVVPNRPGNGGLRIASVYIGYALRHEESPVTPEGIPELPAEPTEEEEQRDPDHAGERERKERRERRERGDEDEDEDEESYGDD